MLGAVLALLLGFSFGVDSYLKKMNYSGVVLMAKGDEVVFSRAYGQADKEEGLPNSEKTTFRIGSITKQFTAASILKLAEMGLIKLTDPISLYFPDYPEGEKITIHHLLSHTAGIPSVMALPNFDELKKGTTALNDTIRQFEKLPLRFQPGEGCEYSDLGYLLLGALIEKVSQCSYEEFLQQHFLSALGMKNTFLSCGEAKGYKNGEVADFIDPYFPHAAGGLASNVGDLFKWSRALFKGELLEKSSLFFQVHGENCDSKITYGYGLRISSQNKGFEGCRDSIIGHLGTIDGFKAALVHYYDQDLTLILLSNEETTPLSQIHRDLADFFFSFSWR